ncbi:MAG: sirohydrochlorin chelatase [Candidatus Humimicrobiaceae bacterium]
MKAILILAHGSKRKSTEETLDILVEKVKQKTGLDFVFGAFLQFSSNNISSAIEKIIKKGGDDIKVIPLFLFDGVHVAQDIPEQLCKVKSQHPEITIRTSAHIGPDDKIVDIIMDRIRSI